ncbi:MAG: FlgD immunoglobulin-like domain containing protein, partial [Candidatus Fermentibacteria bacterium]
MSPPSGELEDWCVKEYNLFGDPELPMWFFVASELAASHTAAISGAATVTVTVTSSGSPVSGARVCLQKGDWQSGDIYLVETSNTAGECTFYVNPSSTGSISVVAWARDHISYQGTIAVTGTGFESGDPTGHTNRLDAVYPSPALNSAAIPFSIASNGYARVDIYDLSGRLVKKLAACEMTAGEHSITWTLEDSNGEKVPSGMYHVLVSTDSWMDSINLVVAR